MYIVIIMNLFVIGEYEIFYISNPLKKMLLCRPIKIMEKLTIFSCTKI